MGTDIFCMLVVCVYKRRERRRGIDASGSEW